MKENNDNGDEHISLWMRLETRIERSASQSARSQTRLLWHLPLAPFRHKSFKHKHALSARIT